VAGGTTVDGSEAVPEVAELVDPLGAASLLAVETTLIAAAPVLDAW
jgi:hypothetical protein